MATEQGSFRRSTSPWRELLRLQEIRQPDAPAFTYLQNNNPVAAWNFRALAATVEGTAQWLSTRVSRGDRVVLAFPPGLEFASALWACLTAGIVAVPVYPPDIYRQESSLARLAAITAETQAAMILTTAGVFSSLDRFAAQNVVRQLPWNVVDRALETTASHGDEPMEPNDLAIIQYTSGSTMSPRGVMVSHANLLYALELLSAECSGSGNVVVGWVPLYHDLGLLGLALCPPFLGVHGVLMSPFEFLQHPVRWLQAITHYRGTLSGAPNFAYELCVQRVSDEQRKHLDLGCWEIAINGAEPIRPETIDAFANHFGPCGFRRNAFYSGYGLAEATLPVAGGPKLREPRSIVLCADRLRTDAAAIATSTGPRKQLAGCGQVLAGTEVRIVDPKTMRPCEANAIGEIWVRGPQVTLGYWQQPQETEKVFGGKLEGDCGVFLRTGDLGFLLDGELYVTGRIKDTIIVDGRNHYPQDLELTAEASHPLLRPGSSAAFAIDRGGECLAMVLELRNRKLAVDAAEVFANIRQTVANLHGIRPAELALVRPGGIPRTTSGKLRRQACREAYLNGELEQIASWPSAIDQLEVPIATPCRDGAVEG